MKKEKTEMKKEKTEWKKVRAFTMSNTLFAALKIMAEGDGISMSLEVSNLVAAEWEKRVHNGDRAKMLEKLGETKEKVQ